MAEDNETKNVEVKETEKKVASKKETGKKTEKKVATGSTKKMVQKRSSSVAGKAASKKTEGAKTTKTSKETKSNTTTKKAAKNKTETTTAKASTKQKAIKSGKKEVDDVVIDKEEKTKSPRKVESREEKNKTNKINKTTKRTGASKKEKEQNTEINEKKENDKLQKREDTTIEQAVGEEIKKNKKLPNEVFNKINSRVFQDVILAVAIMVYLNFIALGFANVETSIFITDLKVFSVVLLFVSIGIFEYAYKKDSGRYALLGIEVLMLAFTTVGFIYVDLMLSDKFTGIAAILVYVFSIYYVGKAIIIYNKMKKEYFVNEMKKIIKK